MVSICENLSKSVRKIELPSWNLTRCKWPEIHGMGWRSLTGYVLAVGLNDPWNQWDLYVFIYCQGDLEGSETDVLQGTWCCTKLQNQMKITTTKQGTQTVTEYANILKSLWQEINHYQNFRIKCSDNTTILKKFIERESPIFSLVSMSNLILFGFKS